MKHKKTRDFVNEGGGAHVVTDKSARKKLSWLVKRGIARSRFSDTIPSDVVKI